jgi:2,5-diamino-6-(ribosylamino)-4(3H)-pyrimidinone 5'-phosphate reductase
LTAKILRLYPLPARESPAEGIYEDLEFPAENPRDPTLPYVIINMVSSVDGRIAVEGKSSSLGSELDRQTMRSLRSKADAVMVGAGTLRAERLSLGLDEPAEGQPLAVIATSTGDVPLESNLIVGEHQEVLVVTTRDSPEGLEGHLRASVLRVPAAPSGAVDLGEALRILKAEHAVRLLLVEGGPSLNYALISFNLADELFLTLAPRLLGGPRDEAFTILDGPAPLHSDVNLLAAHLTADELFLRYYLHHRRCSRIIP